MIYAEELSWHYDQKLKGGYHYLLPSSLTRALTLQKNGNWKDETRFVLKSFLTPRKFQFLTFYLQVTSFVVC